MISGQSDIKMYFNSKIENMLSVEEVYSNKCVLNSFEILYAMN